MKTKKILFFILILFGTISAFAQSPLLWFRADKGVNTAAGVPGIDNTQLTTWYDQAIADGSQDGGLASVHPMSPDETDLPVLPFYRYSNGFNFNFNPVVHFDGTNAGQAVQFSTPAKGSQTVFVVFNSIGMPSGIPGNHYFGGLLYGGDVLTTRPHDGDNILKSDLSFSVMTDGRIGLGGGSDGDFNQYGTLNLQNMPSIGTFKRNVVSTEEVYTDLFASGTTEQPTQNIDPTNTRTGEGRDLINLGRIGKHFSAYEHGLASPRGKLTGNVAEVLTFNGVLSEADRAKVESYLAIKYGITLTGGLQQFGPTVGNVNYDYVNSTGVVIRASDAIYKYDIFGLGRDDYYTLNQRISKSNNAGDILTVSTNSDFTNMNLYASRTAINGDQEFMLFGNNKGSADAVNVQTTELPTGIVSRLDREWNVAHANTDGTNISNFSLKFDLSGFTFTGADASNIRLLVDTDGDGDFTTGTIMEIPADSFMADSSVQFDNLNLSNGVVFTLGIIAPPVDIGILKVGPISAEQGSTISYKLHVTNNSLVDVTNVVVKDPAVDYFTVIGVSAEAGAGTGGTAIVPSSLTVAELQGAGLIIPSMPAGSAVVFTVTGTVGNTIDAVITNTATVENPYDSNPSNNSSTVNTHIYECFTDESTYTIDAAATLAYPGNTINPNGGTIQLVYKLTSGTAVPGIGNEFTQSFTYSALNNHFGANNQWEVLGTGGPSSNFLTLSPKTVSAPNVPPTAGSLYLGLPTNNSTAETFMPTNNQTDNIFTTKIENGELDELGRFTTSIGNFPAAPAGYISTASKFTLYANGNRTTGGGENRAGFWMKPLATSEIRNDGTSGTIRTDIMAGETIEWRYSAFSNGTSFSTNYPASSTDLRGVTLLFDNSITYAISSTDCPCVNPGATGDALTSSVGILTKGNSTPSVTNWPQSVPNGYLVLDAAQKGFVITHKTTEQRDALTPVAGMMIYNTDLNCVQLYRGTSPAVAGSGTGWVCIERGCNEITTAPKTKLRLGYWSTFSIGGAGHETFKSQLQNSVNYGPTGTFEGLDAIVNDDFTSINVELITSTAQELIDNYDIIVTGWTNMTEPYALKLKEFVDGGGVLIALLDNSVGSSLHQAFGGTGLVGGGAWNSPGIATGHALNNGLFGDARNVSITGVENSAHTGITQLPAGSTLLATETDTNYAGVWLTGADNRAIFVWDEGIFRHSDVAGTDIDTDQERFLHNLFAYALEKAGF